MYVANSGRVFKSRDRALNSRNMYSRAFDEQRMFICLLLKAFRGSFRINYIRPVL